MAKPSDNVRVRLRAAALELFLEHGFDRATAAEIAARVGVTERTFFRHFPDKKEVLFDGEAAIRVILCEAIQHTPAGIGALDTLLAAFRALEPILAERRSYVVSRNAVINATPALQERELAKLSSLTDALKSALQKRGDTDLRATLASKIGMAAFTHVALEWIENPEGGLGERLDQVSRELGMLMTESNILRDR